jgi:hypothetical protein
MAVGAALAAASLSGCADTFSAMQQRLAGVATDA